MAIETYSDLDVKGPEGRIRRVTDVRFFSHLGEVTFRVDGTEQSLLDREVVLRVPDGVPLERMIMSLVREQVLREWAKYPEARPATLEYVIEIDGLPEGFKAERAYELEDGSLLILLVPDTADHSARELTNKKGYRIFTGSLAAGVSEVKGRVLVQEIIKHTGETLTMIRFYKDDQLITLTLSVAAGESLAIQVGTGPITQSKKSHKIQLKQSK